MVYDQNKITTNNITIINSWPSSIKLGSGAAFFMKGLSTQLKKKGRNLKIFCLDESHKSYHLYLMKRIIFNILLAFKTKFNNEIVLGFDFDGFCVSRKNNFFIAFPRGILADIAPHEKRLNYLSLKFQAFLEKINLKRAGLIIVSSQYAKKKVVKLYNINLDKIAIIANGFELNTWKKYLSSQLLKKRNKKRILGVAKFYPRKKVEVLIKAFNLVLKKNKNVELFLVGDGFELTKMKNLVKKLNINNYVVFCGNVVDREKMAFLYKNCDIFCHPSIQENFSNVLLEAMASSKPIVAAKAASMPEIVKNRVNGLLFPPNNSKILSEKLLELINDNSFCLKLGKKGYDILVKNYLWEDKINEFIDCFDRAVLKSYSLDK